MGQKTQGAAGHFFGIQQFDGAGGGIARVGKGGQAIGIAFGIQLVKIRRGHVDFPAHLQQLGRILRQGERYAPDGAHIGRDVIPRASISARGCVCQLARTVEQGYRAAINLGLHSHSGQSLPQAAAQALVKLHQLRIGVALARLVLENIVDTLHGGRVGHFAESLAQVVAHTLGRGIRGNELRVFALQLLDFAVEFIVFGIADFRLRLGVVQFIIVAHHGAELCVALGRAGLLLLFGKIKEVHIAWRVS